MSENGIESKIAFSGFFENEAWIFVSHFNPEEKKKWGWRVRICLSGYRNPLLWALNGGYECDQGSEGQAGPGGNTYGYAWQKIG